MLKADNTGWKMIVYEERLAVTVQNFYFKMILKTLYGDQRVFCRSCRHLAKTSTPIIFHSKAAAIIAL